MQPIANFQMRLEALREDIDKLVKDLKQLSMEQGTSQGHQMTLPSSQSSPQHNYGPVSQSDDPYSLETEYENYSQMKPSEISTPILESSKERKPRKPSSRSVRANAPRYTEADLVDPSKVRMLSNGSLQGKVYEKNEKGERTGKEVNRIVSGAKKMRKENSGFVPTSRLGGFTAGEAAPGQSQPPKTHAFSFTPTHSTPSIPTPYTTQLAPLLGGSQPESMKASNQIAKARLQSIREAYNQ